MRPSSRPPLAAAFAAAVPLVANVLAGRTPEAALRRLGGDLQPAARDLALTTLRDYGRGDFFLSRLLAKPLVEREARALLLLALARLERRPQDAHTIVNEAVAAAAGFCGGRYKALTNGVLRNFLRRREELLAAAQADETANWRHPVWWLQRLREAAPQTWRDIAVAGNQHPPMCLRVNRRRATPEAVAAELQQAGVATQLLDGEAILLPQPVAVDKLPGFAAGRFSVQDYGAQQAARLLDAGDGQRVLDACAAPGGKAAHLLERAAVDLTALESDARRMPALAANLERLGLDAALKVADATQTGAWWDGAAFDRILLDAPCSASGVARRHPDSKWLRREGDVEHFARRQAQLLASLWPTLKVGGKMLYCTCSMFARENEQLVESFVMTQENVKRIPLQGPGSAGMLSPTAYHDGFFFALLHKES